MVICAMTDSKHGWKYSLILFVVIFGIICLSKCSAESPQAWVKRVLALDGYTAEHAVTGAFIGSTYSNDGVAEYLYFHGWKDEPYFTDWQTVKASLWFNFWWEFVIEFAIDTKWNYQLWCDIYGGEYEAWRNNIVDCVVVTGCAYLTTRKHWMRDLLFGIDKIFTSRKGLTVVWEL